MLQQKVLLITPPFVQMNTPYPSTVNLKGYLKSISLDVSQADLGLETILELFSKRGLQHLFDKVLYSSILSRNAKSIWGLKDLYINTVDSVICYLQNQDPTLAQKICTRNYLPEANRFQQVDEMDWAFGSMGLNDKARHLCTLFLEDISDFIVETVDPDFGFSRYAEQIASYAQTFDDLHEKLHQDKTFIDDVLLKLLDEKMLQYKPDVVGLSVPFPGNLYSALRCGNYLKAKYPDVSVVMGGGYPNTELRSLQDERIFKYLDFITLDDGELPLRNLLEYLSGEYGKEHLVRTFLAENGKVVFYNNDKEKDIEQSKNGVPDYGDLPLDKYLSVIETVNPMQSLWSNGRWNKLTLAHGCYWAKCSFCDTSLDYIKRYEPLKADEICDKIEAIINQTGSTGFHFVDEAAPPSLLKALALEIIKRGLNVTWWTNIRFEKSFTRDLCTLLAASGCIAVSGGLEVASDRLLNLINKGVSVEQVAQVTANFTQANILVHAYLMYGFPSETHQETINSLEVVRQLFELGIVQSGFWHRFAMTAHSPVGMNPKQFKVIPEQTKSFQFANNELVYTEENDYDHGKFSEGLKKSLYNYMHDFGFDFPLQEWFDFKIKPPTIAPNYIESVLEMHSFETPSENAKVIWLGKAVNINFVKKQKKKRVFENAQIELLTNNKFELITLNKGEGAWLFNTLNQLSQLPEHNTKYRDLKLDFEEELSADFTLFWNSKPVLKVRELGLLTV